MVAMLGLLVAVVSGKPNSPMVEGTFEEDAQVDSKVASKSKDAKSEGAKSGEGDKETEAKDGTAGEEKPVSVHVPEPEEPLEEDTNVDSKEASHLNIGQISFWSDWFRNIL